MAFNISYVVWAFGGLIVVVCVAGLMFPGWLIDSVRRVWQRKGAMVLAVAFRVVLGTLLIVGAPQTRFPTAFRIIGALGLVAAVGLPILGWQRVDNILKWAQGLPQTLQRTWLLLGVGVGSFLIYGVTS